MNLPKKPTSYWLKLAAAAALCALTCNGAYQAITHANGEASLRADDITRRAR